MLASWGPLGVFLLAVSDSAGIPIVGGVDVLIVLVAVMDPAAAYWSAAAGTAGSVIGSLALFFIARKGGEQYLNRYTSTGRGARLRLWFQEYGLLTIFVPSVVPVIPLPLKIFILSAGALGVRPLPFTLVLTLARIPRYVFVAWLGTRLGKDTLPYLRHHMWELGLFALALFVVLYLVVRFLHWRVVTKSASSDPE